MRYGAIPTTPVEWLALLLDKAPLPVLDTLIAPLQARALIVAAQTGLLDALAEQPADTRSLAARQGADEECLHLLLRLLRAMGYLELTSGTWRLSALGRRHFGPGAPEPYSAYVRFGAQQWQLLEQLDTLLERGTGVDFHQHQSREDWQAYQRAMLENAESFAWFVADRVEVPKGATRCLDLGGSHGRVGAALCRRHPGLRSTVLDLPDALPAAQELARRHGYDDVVRFQAADLTRAALPPGQDVVLLCNVVHHFSEETNLALLARTREALVPGGTLALFDLEAPAADARPDAAGDAMALYFRLTSTSRVLRGADYAGWLERSGFRARVVRSVKLPARVLVLGTPR